MTYDFDPTSTTYFDATNSYYKYDVKVGEEYIETVSYTSSLTDSSGNVQINVANSYTAGDQVTIAQADGGVANPNLEGLFTVLSATGSDFVVNSLWSEVGDATIDGDVKYADNRKTVTRDIITSLNNYVFNGALPFKDWRTYDKDDYQMVAIGAQTDKLLLTMPQDFTMTPEQDLWLNMMQDVNANANVYFENSDGDILYKSTPSTELINQIAVGPNNHGTLLVDTGSLPLVKSTTTYYDVWSTSFNAQRSLKYRIHIDRRCKINDYEIIFLDRMGSIGSFAFQLRYKLTGQVTKDTYNQDIVGAVTSQEWSYESYEQGTKVINPRIKEIYELNTNWMDENDNDYFTQLVSSPQTWIKLEDGNYYACTIETTNFEKERQRNRNLIRKPLKVYLSTQDVING